MKRGDDPVTLLPGWSKDDDAPCSWCDLEFEELDYTPPRSRQMYQSDGRPWVRPEGLLVFATDAALQAWEAGSIAQ